MRSLRLIISLALIFMLASPEVALGAAAGESAPRSRSAGIMVKLRPGKDISALAPSSGAAGRRIGRGRIYRIRAGGDPTRALATLRADPAVEWAEPDYIRELSIDYTSTPNDPDFRDETYLMPSAMWLTHARSWYLRGPGSIQADEVWPYLALAVQDGAEASSSAFPVAVIDSGFYMTHPDAGPYITAAKDCLATYTYATDTVTIDDDVTPVPPGAPGNDAYMASHGTCVAGEVAAGVNNGIGIVGAAYDTPVRVYKVQGVCIDGIPESGIVPGQAIILDSAVVDAIYRATDDGCKVINMSLGGPDPSDALQDAIDYAHANGVLVVAASGNYPTRPVQYPAACEHVIGVGSYRVDSNLDADPQVRRSSFTSSGTGLDLLAPGEAIWGLTKPDYDADGASTIARSGYMMWSGTSMAAPLVAGGAAALWRLAPDLTNDELADALFRSAGDMGPSGYDIGYGWGAFNMAAARSALHLRVTRVEGTTETGTDRIGTAIAASRLAFPEPGVPHVLLATARNWPDALGGAALAGALDAPVLLTRQGELPDAVAAEISRLGAQEVIVLGGTSAVSEPVLAQLAEIPGVTTVERIAGDTRYATARLVAARAIDELGAGWDGTALVATGEAFPDALAGSALCAARGWPIYLLPPGTDEQAFAGRIRADGAESALILGGPSAVPLEVEDQLEAALGDAAVTRLGGATRYETAVEVARHGVDRAGLDWGYPGIAVGEDFPDALSGGVMQGHTGGIVLFARRASLPEVTRAELAAHKESVEGVRFIGGTAALSTEVRLSVTAALTR